MTCTCWPLVERTLFRSPSASRRASAPAAVVVTSCTERRSAPATTVALTTPREGGSKATVTVVLPSGSGCGVERTRTSWPATPGSELPSCGFGPDAGFGPAAGFEPAAESGRAAGRAAALAPSPRCTGARERAPPSETGSWVSATDPCAGCCAREAGSAEAGSPAPAGRGAAAPPCPGTASTGACTSRLVRPRPRPAVANLPAARRGVASETTPDATGARSAVTLDEGPAGTAVPLPTWAAWPGSGSASCAGPLVTSSGARPATQDARSGAVASPPAPREQGCSLSVTGCGCPGTRWLRAGWREVPCWEAVCGKATCWSSVSNWNRLPFGSFPTTCVPLGCSCVPVGPALAAETGFTTRLRVSS